MGKTVLVRGLRDPVLLYIIGWLVFGELGYLEIFKIGFKVSLEEELLVMVRKILDENFAFRIRKGRVEA